VKSLRKDFLPVFSFQFSVFTALASQRNGISRHQKDAQLKNILILPERDNEEF
jgi:hypothetical protein